MKKHYPSYDLVDVSSFVGKTFNRVEKYQGDEGLIFEDSDGDVFIMCHHQDCCEGVSLEDITGDLADLIGTPILIAEERTSGENPMSKYDEYFQWTFYTFRTIRGSVDLRWYGQSNGYYSVDAPIYKGVSVQ